MDPNVAIIGIIGLVALALGIGALALGGIINWKSKHISGTVAGGGEPRRVAAADSDEL
ncbi:hypothetical protein VT84_07395 [Gemmata sp. SH-PL17]|uniref:hypothetical protein n=1 Tax=Gemmata sp. SH-PL17 TaxID=1630693 RepID=UPI00078C3E41|nr:hypothetical protein [Gemmata sp. SH-PL17]AMV24205.1 hypothetical protein VT84_07395 [Gemmata sp. SH-PL17]